MPNAWAGLHADQLGLQPTDTNTQAMFELWTADQVAFYTGQSLLHTTALPVSGLHMEMGQPVDSVDSQIRAKSV